jgi:hypothetical protein
VILAHPSVPWQAEAISMATHKANVYIDLSGWRPKYFPPELVHAAARHLRDKVMFGSDYPLITPERWMADAAVGLAARGPAGDPQGYRRAAARSGLSGWVMLEVWPDARYGPHRNRRCST